MKSIKIVALTCLVSGLSMSGAANIIPEEIRAFYASLPSMDLADARYNVGRIADLAFVTGAVPYDELEKIVASARSMDLETAKKTAVALFEAALPGLPKALEDYPDLFGPDLFGKIAASEAWNKEQFLTKYLPYNIFTGIADAAKMAQTQQAQNALAGIASAARTQYYWDAAKKYAPYAAAIPLAAAAYYYRKPITETITNWYGGSNAPEAEGGEQPSYSWYNLYRYVPSLPTWSSEGSWPVNR